MSRFGIPFPILADGTEMLDPTHWQPLQDALALCQLGVFGRNQYMGGSDVVGLDASATGSFNLSPRLEFKVDNTGNQIVASMSIVVQVRFFLRVSDAAITVTPRIWDVDASAPATISGATACAATNADYSNTGAGLIQQQTIALTLANANRRYRPQLTIGGTVAAGLQVWGHALFDCYMDV